LSPTRRGKARLGQVRLGGVWLGWTWPGAAWQGWGGMRAIPASLMRLHARQAERLFVDQLVQTATRDASSDRCRLVTHGFYSGLWSCPGLLPYHNGSHARLHVWALVIHDQRPALRPGMLDPRGSRCALATVALGKTGSHISPLAARTDSGRVHQTVSNPSPTPQAASYLRS
jgi:hypothetical protein